MAEPAALQARVDVLRLGRRPILREVELSCSSGTHTAILGPNGAGKTSLLRALVGLLEMQGEVRAFGAPLETLSAGERARTIAYVPQRSLLQSALSVRDVVMQGRYAHQSGRGRPDATDRRAVGDAMDLTDTSTLALRNYLELSGGEQRRVLLARALATQAPIVALDEPTASLDISHQLDFFERLNALRDLGRTVITVLHDLRDAARFADRALVLSAGGCVYAGPSALPEALVQDVFGVNLIPNAQARYERLPHRASEGSNAPGEHVSGQSEAEAAPREAAP